jgi:cell fate regulator YaaT (PSP1 superfamily)
MVCKKIQESSGLNMKLLKAEYSLDRQKLTFYYTADGRIDFRQLVKDLARVFKTRIEMRQVGVRDSTKILGGLAVCGRELCCATHLRHFDNISITVAKDQNLIFNPSKITGLCGRLMCCLLYEKDIYEDILVENGKEYIQLVDDEAGGDL